MTSRRESYSAQFKRKVILCAEANSNHYAAEEYGVGRTCVIRWRRQRDQIFSCASTRKKFTGPQRGQHPELEAEVAEFIREERKNGFSVTCDGIREKANAVAKRLDIPRNVFRASRGWVQRFMKRQGFSIRRRTTICQKLPQDFEQKVINFQRYVTDLRRKKGFLMGQIGNADETAVYLDMPRPTTVNEVGAKEVTIRTTGHEKLRVTVMLCITADGRKLPPYLILKRKTLPKGEPFPKDVAVRCQAQGWMTSELMVDWLKTVWLRRPGALFHLPSMLVLDSFRGHITEEVKDQCRKHDSDLVVIPGGLTSLLQPLDVSINKPFKANLRAEYEAWIRDGARERTPAGKIRKASPATIAQWVSDAWKAIRPEIVEKSFKKCSISNALDGTEDDILWEDNLAGNSDSDSVVSTDGGDDAF